MTMRWKVSRCEQDHGSRAESGMVSSKSRHSGQEESVGVPCCSRFRASLHIVTKGKEQKSHRQITCPPGRRRRVWQQRSNCPPDMYTSSQAYGQVHVLCLHQMRN